MQKKLAIGKCKKKLKGHGTGTLVLYMSLGIFLCAFAYLYTLHLEYKKLEHKKLFFAQFIKYVIVTTVIFIIEYLFEFLMPFPVLKVMLFPLGPYIYSTCLSYGMFLWVVASFL